MPRRVTTIAFDSDADEKLAQLARELELTKTAVIRNALSLYAYVRKELLEEPDRDLAIVRKGAIEAKVILHEFVRANKAG